LFAFHRHGFCVTLWQKFPLATLLQKTTTLAENISLDDPVVLGERKSCYDCRFVTLNALHKAL